MVILKSAFDVNWLWNENSTSPRRSKTSNARTFSSWALLVSSAWLHIRIWRLIGFRKIWLLNMAAKSPAKKKLKQLAKISPKNYFSFFLLSKIYISMPHDGKIFPALLLFLSWNLLENILFRLNCKLSKSPRFVE